MQEHEPDLTRLLAQTASGNRPAFHQLYSAVSSKLFGVVLRIVRDRAIAEDVLQDTFLRIWRKAADYDPKSGRPVTWMAAIARNAAIDVVRQRQTARNRFADTDEDSLEALADPDADAVHPTDREALRRCLGTLEDEQRTVVLLAYQDGYSREELAERFDRPVGTIKTWLHRSLARLKECLERP
ncbi:sigma-70 family RNA polymerase sigma factor [Chthonobacter albigriseus]|uniref:sigma-70 family RNA polymerase sigma factor n=1 Tax=Chthonobacter albigriseus TaxID=1683161 RepID=UPI001FCEA90F|nr:sigma-70 family RNA polymerase sigma factor [Chthonobacter albigriseus]